MGSCKRLHLRDTQMIAALGLGAAVPAVGMKLPPESCEPSAEFGRIRSHLRISSILSAASRWRLPTT